MPVIPTVGGMAYFLVGALQLRVRGDFKVQPDNIQCEGIAGQDGVFGAQPRARHPYGGSGHFR